MNKEVTPPIIVDKDPDKERDIDIIYQDLRPDQSPPVKEENFLEKLKGPVDCLEISFENQNKHTVPFRSIFFDQEDLNKAFDHARLAVKFSRKDGQPIDPNSARLVRYEHEEAVRLGIIQGFRVI